jgi:hypothetical protein
MGYSIAVARADDLQKLYASDFIWSYTADQSRLRDGQLITYIENHL